MSDKASAVLGVLLLLLGFGYIAALRICLAAHTVLPPDPPAVTAPTQPTPAQKPVTLAPVPSVSL